MNKQLFALSLFMPFFLLAQEIQLDFQKLSNQELQIYTFEGMDVIPLAQYTFDAEGKVQINLDENIEGMGYLSLPNQEQNLIIALSDEKIYFKGNDFSDYSTIQVLEGEENKAFFAYSNAYPKRMQVLSAWSFLQERYENEKILGNNKKIGQQIEKEINRIEQTNQDLINHLPANSYIKWFIPKRKLVSDVAMIAQQQPQLIPSTIEEFRRLDYSDMRLFKSGLFREAIENHFWLIENGVGSLEQVFKEMKISIDAMQENLEGDELKFNMAFSHLFDVLEQRSLFQASEYLAIHVLEQNECEIDASLTKKLETYRKMKKGNQVADILFSNTIFNGENEPQKLSDVNSNYILVVFGSSWCPACTEEIPEINNYYKEWKEKGVEVVLVSLDTNLKAYQNFANQFDFISTCDLKKWNTKAVEDYYVNATPSMFLLDQDRKLLLKPKNINHANSWISHYVK